LLVELSRKRSAAELTTPISETKQTETGKSN
jgi:hypothetical protein